MNRDLFADLTEALSALAAEREGKATLRKVKVRAPEPVSVSADEIKAVRAAAHASHGRHGAPVARECADVPELGARHCQTEYAGGGADQAGGEASGNIADAGSALNTLCPRTSRRIGGFLFCSQ